MAEPWKLRQKPLWWRRDHGSYDRGKRQLAGGKNRALNSRNVEKRNIQNTVYNYVVEKLGKTGRELSKDDIEILTVEKV